MQDLYNSNKDFKRYVDRHCQHYNEGRSISLEEALEHKLVREYGEMCRERENDLEQENRE